MPIRKGQSIVETLVGIIVLVPIALFLLDILVICFANIANDNLAKSSARAAASAVSSDGIGTAEVAFDSASLASSSLAESGIIKKPSGGSFLTGFCWNADGVPQTRSWPSATGMPSVGDLGVITSVEVHLPIPFPFLPSSYTFRAKAVEPIVSIASGGSGSGDSGKGGVKTLLVAP